VLERLRGAAQTYVSFVDRLWMRARAIQAACSRGTRWLQWYRPL